jgi:hypothetical protein
MYNQGRDCQAIFVVILDGMATFLDARISFVPLAPLWRHRGPTDCRCTDRTLIAIFFYAALFISGIGHRG